VGIFIDLLQMDMIEENSKSNESFEKRIDRLENQLISTQKLLREVMVRLEKELGEDIDKDGKVGI